MGGNLEITEAGWLEGTSGVLEPNLLFTAGALRAGRPGPCPEELCVFLRTAIQQPLPAPVAVFVHHRGNWCLPFIPSENFPCSN